MNRPLKPLQLSAESHSMVRRAAVFAAVLLLCLGGACLLRPALTRPVLADPLVVHSGVAERDSTPASNVAGSMAAYQPRARYGRRLEPMDSLLHGAGQSDRGSFDRYSAVTGSHPTLYLTYTDLRDDLPAYFTRLAADLAHFDTPGHKTVPQIGLALNRGEATRNYEAETAAGVDDAALAQLCTGIRALHRPVFVRPGYEFNGPWNGYQPEPYVASFRRVAAALHSCDPAIAVVWNWSPDAELDAEAAGYSAATFAGRLQAFYPGDDAVDWWALNLFTPQGIASPATAAFLRMAAGSSHPVMVAESTPKGFDATSAAVRDSWFSPWFGLLRTNPGIKAFCYINWNWAAYPQWSDWGDARLEAAAALLAWYRAQLATLPLDGGLQPHDMHSGTASHTAGKPGHKL